MMQTRYANASPQVAILALFALTLAIVTAAYATWKPLPSSPGSALSSQKKVDTDTDVKLYLRIIDRVHAGEAYHAVATDEQRRHGYPLRPFVVVRPPALALFLGALPNVTARVVALQTLIGAFLYIWSKRLRRFIHDPLFFSFVMLALAIKFETSVGLDNAYTFHEIWAGLLIGISIAVRTSQRWILSVALGLFAGLIRELALPYLCVMALMALREHRHKEVMAWLVAVFTAGVALWFHAHATWAYTQTIDQASQGWVRLAGWQFALKTSQWVFGTHVWVQALLLPLTLLAAFGWPDERGSRIALVLSGYTLGFMVIGRSENDYWGFILLPLLMLCLPMIIPALADLKKTIFKFGQFSSPAEIIGDSSC